MWVLGRSLRRRRRRGQATVEFAFVAPLFFLCFFGAIDAALWAVQSSASVSATEETIRTAAGASGSGLDVKDTPSIDAVYDRVAPKLKLAMFGTTVAKWCWDQAQQNAGMYHTKVRPGAHDCSQSPQSTGSNITYDANDPFNVCPRDPKDVERVFGARTIVICVQSDPNTNTAANPCDTPGQIAGVTGDTPWVRVEVVGYLASLVPPAYGLGWNGGEIPMDVGSMTRSFRFCR